MTTLENRTTTVPVLDSLRGFAALAVCLYHFICTTTGFINTAWILDIFSFGKSGVQLFFVISGFIIPWSMENAGYRLKNFFSFLLKRLIRLEPPYIVSLILAIFILLMRERILGTADNLQELSFVRIFIHFGYLIPFFSQYEWINQVYWTLAIEFQYYLFIALIFIPLKNAVLPVRLLIYTAFIVLGFTTDSHFLPYWLPVFLMGVLLYLNKAERIGKTEFYVVTFVLLFYNVLFYGIGEAAFCLLGIVMILHFSGFTSKLGRWLGKISYSLYLIHPIIGATVINVLSHHVAHPAAKAAVIALGLAVSLVGALLMYWFVEKPSKNISSRIKYLPS